MLNRSKTTGALLTQFSKSVTSTHKARIHNETSALKAQRKNALSALNKSQQYFNFASNYQLEQAIYYGPTLRYIQIDDLSKFFKNPLSIYVSDSLYRVRIKPEPQTEVERFLLAGGGYGDLTARLRGDAFYGTGGCSTLLDMQNYCRRDGFTGIVMGIATLPLTDEFRIKMDMNTLILHHYGCNNVYHIENEKLHLFRSPDGRFLRSPLNDKLGDYFPYVKWAARGAYFRREGRMDKVPNLLKDNVPIDIPKWIEEQRELADKQKIKAKTVFFAEAKKSETTMVKVNTLKLG